MKVSKIEIVKILPLSHKAFWLIFCLCYGCEYISVKTQSQSSLHREDNSGVITESPAPSQEVKICNGSKLLKQEASCLVWLYFLAVHKVAVGVIETDELRVK